METKWRTEIMEMSGIWKQCQIFGIVPFVGCMSGNQVYFTIISAVRVPVQVVPHVVHPLTVQQPTEDRRQVL